jgi:hypothetical protein
MPLLLQIISRCEPLPSVPIFVSSAFLLLSQTFLPHLSNEELALLGDYPLRNAAVMFVSFCFTSFS